jgi:hypothetical protein
VRWESSRDEQTDVTPEDTEPQEELLAVRHSIKPEDET